MTTSTTHEPTKERQILTNPICRGKSETDSAHSLAPFDYRVDPRVSEMERESFEWACSLGMLEPGTPLYNQTVAAEFIWLVAATLPPNPSRELMRVRCDMMLLFFLYDDTHVMGEGKAAMREAGSIVNTMVRVLEASKPLQSAAGQGPFVVGFADIMARLRRASRSAAQIDRFILAKQWYLQTHQWVLDSKRNRQSVNSYLAMREYDIGLLPHLAINDLYYHPTPVPSLLNHPILEHTRRLSSWHVILTNDLFGYRKEMVDGDRTSNLVLLLSDREHISEQEAARLVANMIQGVVEDYSRCERLMARIDFSDQSRKFLRYTFNGQKCWMRGHAEWYARSGRYVVAEDRLARARCAASFEA